MNGLVLGGGAARGIAHIGIWKQIEASEIDFNIITGTSMGAIVGAFIADGKSAADILKVLKEISWVSLISKPAKGCLQDGEKATRFFKEHFGNKKIENLQKKYACVVTDINSGEEITLDKGSLVDALRGTMSIPGIFMPHYYQRRFLVDGGVTNNLPILQAEKMGAKNILAINVRQARDRKTLYTNRKKGLLASLTSFTFGPSLFYDGLEKSYDILASCIDERQQQVKAKTNLRIEQLEMKNLRYRDFLKWKRIVAEGEKHDLSKSLRALKRKKK